MSRSLRQYACKIADKYNVETDFVVADVSTTEGIESVKNIEHKIGLVALSAPPQDRL
ncbi:hypothetical protein LRP52_32505 [Photobacterium sp. ZSDE20]|uniref:Uncharacterized protein n=1 Tax=Photobacterium pectinilyticum TaxID=2906793 RepID=A0ABT1N6M9_9GAMM|nr:hypothetical protein [Photobacterium sp. ZSDE20]MCQ1060376.1 hypothetical protein [Photobacterium sp. ZSDE20]MDD1826908.1 hypothetical protein [Photobacterium sp. ZSDE20]